ncbi:MAG TPA: hypothetical protein VK567_24195 [Bradyrhizobium sp.]|nr:hypothetical protein [Bradyrhizobium sp.]
MDSLAARFGFECWRQAWSTALVHRGADGDRGTILLEYGGHPVALDEIELAAALLEGSPKAKLDTTRGSTYRFFETPFGVPMLKAQD